jgi:hypothetical protein
MSMGRCPWANFLLKNVPVPRWREPRSRRQTMSVGILAILSLKQEGNCKLRDLDHF